MKLTQNIYKYTAPHIKTEGGRRVICININDKYSFPAYHLIGLIKSLYTFSEAGVKVDDKLSDEFKAGKGVP